MAKAINPPFSNDSQTLQFPFSIPEGYTNVPGDSRCMFHALSLILGQSSNDILAKIAQELEDNLLRYTQNVFFECPEGITEQEDKEAHLQQQISLVKNAPTSVENYPGSIWLQAAANIFNRPITVNLIHGSGLPITDENGEPQSFRIEPEEGLGLGLGSGSEEALEGNIVLGLIMSQVPHYLAYGSYDASCLFGESSTPYHYSVLNLDLPGIEVGMLGEVWDL